MSSSSERLEEADRGVDRCSQGPSWVMRATISEHGAGGCLNASCSAHNDSRGKEQLSSPY